MRSDQRKPAGKGKATKVELWFFLLVICVLAIAVNDNKSGEVASSETRYIPEETRKKIMTGALRVIADLERIQSDSTSGKIQNDSTAEGDP